MWEKVIRVLEAEDVYESVVLPEKFGLVPYGEFGYQESLIVIVDGERSIHLVLAEALIRAGNWCRDVVKDVLIYVDCDREVWLKYWKVFEPSFSVLMADTGVNIEIVAASELAKVAG